MKVLVVEDDFIVRKGIILSLNWEKEEFQICGEASNGIQGFERVKETLPDIVLTDIRMPLEDGLTFAQRVRDAYPFIKIVILSGYEDFAYAKQALKIGVFEYLLKPVNADELLATIVRLKKEVERERQEYQQASLQQNFIDENYSYVQNRLLNILITEDLSLKGRKEELLGKMRQLRMDLPGPVYQVIIVLVDDFLLLTQNSKEERESLGDAIKNRICQILKISEYDKVFMDESLHFVVILNQKRDGKESLSTLYQEIKEKLGFYITVSLGMVKNQIEEIQKSYREAIEALRYRPFLPGEYVIQYHQGMEKTQRMFVNIQKKENELVQKMLQYDGEGVLEIVREIFDEAQKKQTDFDKLKTACVRIWVIVISNLEEMSIDPEKMSERDYDFLKEIDKYDSFSSLRWQMIHFCRQISEMLSSTEGAKYNIIIQKTMQYVQKYFAEEIRIEQVVSELYITPNYFSQVFKSRTGVNFSDYLNRFRIDKAKEYLKNLDLKIYQVSEKAGYQNYKYFNTVFKKYEGCSPKEYRNNLSFRKSEVER